MTSVKHCSYRKEIVTIGVKSVKSRTMTINYCNSYSNHKKVKLA